MIQHQNFTFKGSAVTLEQNNFCSMGVLSSGMKGNSFDTPQLGIRAQIQYLKAYANNEPLVNPVVDPRFKYVAAPLNLLNGWASRKNHKEKAGQQALAVASASFLIKTNGTEIFQEPPKGETGIGTFTITEVKGNWGKLQSGVGWIALDCCTRLKE